MNRRKIVATAGIIIACLWGNGCKPDLSHERRISLQDVQALTNGGIAQCEEQYGEVFVSITDPHGDCHVFLLEHPDISNKDALSALNAKKEELKKKGTEPTSAGDSHPLAPEK